MKIELFIPGIHQFVTISNHQSIYEQILNKIFIQCLNSSGSKTVQFNDEGFYYFSSNEVIDTKIMNGVVEVVPYVPMEESLILTRSGIPADYADDGTCNLKNFYRFTFSLTS